MFESNKMLTIPVLEQSIRSQVRILLSANNLCVGLGSAMALNGASANGWWDWD